ncbi:MAG: ornithine carbamoyltransferase [Gaiellales bacterium]
MVDVPRQLKGRDLLRIQDWSGDELRAVLDLATELKRLQHERTAHAVLPARTLGMIFDKPSTRTRVSFSAGMAQLGGAALTFASGEMQLGRGETIRDTALVLSRYLDGIVVRTYRQADLDELATHASIPVINGLTDDFHPCQALADVLTVGERFGEVRGVRIAYIGDGNNVCHSLMTICGKLGIDFVAATPEGYDPRTDVVSWSREAAAAAGSTIDLVRDPTVAASGADVLYTDVWTSMGMDAEATQRHDAFSGYTIDERLLARATSRAIVMHDLPAHYGEEVTEDVLHGPRSAAWDQAENRLHAQKALLALVIA